SSSTSSRRRRPSRSCSKARGRSPSSARRWARRIPTIPRRARSAASWRSRCRTTSCTARIPPSRPPARCRCGSAMTSPDALRNRENWDRRSDEYQERNAELIGRQDEPRWGMWQLPDSELGILGDVAGKDVLELGCGAAQWSILLAQLCALGVGRDSSPGHLEHARELMAAAGVDFPLVHGSADEVPLPAAAFDVVFCAHGAMTFADPYRTVPEAARLLRSGGLFAFSHSTPLAMCCWSDETETMEPRLVGTTLGMHRFA